ncbi:protein trichome berefringence-like 7 [Neltuma alba]|uniref:protein trichome berefringence-like 7 n=1 Tax=Neltuma alba TaxID=207710 RepID=UPI0010A488BF|nr:protein trichome berefringence-like 7 [Prosopis alba]
MSVLNRSVSITTTPSFNRRSLGVASPKANRCRRLGLSRWFHFHALVIIGSLISFFVAVGGGYVYLLPHLSHTIFQGQRVSNFNGSLKSCDVYKGRWVRVPPYPLYNASECPFVEQGFNCFANGRRDMSYLNWRWKPSDCDLPRFDVSNVLEMFRGKRIVFVGDSMSRTQWESLICMLMAGVKDKRSVYEVNQNEISKRIRFLGVRFSAFNFTIEYFRSVFLVQPGPVPKHAPKRVKSTLRLDRLDDISDRWADSDVLIFNTGHWWVPSKLFDAGCYFQVGRSLKIGMSIPIAFRTALGTWASWIERKINKNRTRVFFRTYEPSHWSDQPRFTCTVTQYPMPETDGRDQSLFSDLVLEVVKNVPVPINVLHVTSLTAFRSDAHVGNWSDNPSVQDCSHWCLPGVPDTWNEIILSQLLTDYESPSRQMESQS